MSQRDVVDAVRRHDDGNHAKQIPAPYGKSMIETLKKTARIFFHPKSPANVYQNPRRLLTNLIARTLNFYLRFISTIKVGGQAKCNICGWIGPKFGYTAAISVDYYRADDICLRCGSNRRTRLLMEVFAQHVELTADHLTVADVGGAKSTWHYFERYANVKYLSVDPYKEADVRSDITDIDLPDNSVESVICCHVLEHVEDYRKGMTELFRILKPGCYGVIAVPQTSGLKQTKRTGEKTYEGYGHVWDFGEDFAIHLQAVGFRVATVNLRECESDNQSVRWPYHVVQKPSSG
jgi:SAM-dependent methyltransferase